MKRSVLTAVLLEEQLDNSIGGKAKNLFHLTSLGLNVPRWIVIPQSYLINLANDEGTLHIPDELIESILSEFDSNQFLAVRSSALDEDGGDFSFAGLFETKLFVTKNNLKEQIQEVWKSAFSERVQLYRKTNNLAPSNGLGIIIQEMIDAESAGVAFGINPVTGDRNQQLVSAVYGLGEGLVSGELNSDNYLVNNNIIIKIKCSSIST